MDIRNRDMSKALTFKLLWLQEMYKKIRLAPELVDVPAEVIKKYLLKIYEKRRLVDGRFYNNTTAENKIINQEDFINLFLNKTYILSRLFLFVWESR